jgi:hypothetical protein
VVGFRTLRNDPIDAPLAIEQIDGLALGQQRFGPLYIAESAQIDRG